jgi:streptomycin 6-kinase
MDPQDERRGSGDFATETDPVRMGAILEQHLQVPGGRPFQVVRCQPKFTRGGTSRSLFQYDITLRDADGREWRESVSGVTYGAERTRKAWARLRLSRVEARTEPSIQRAAYVADLDLLLQVFPFDHKLRALEPLMEGSLAELRAPILARFGPGNWHLDGWQAKANRYRVDLRASVKLTVSATESQSGRAADRRFFAKVYSHSDQVERAWAVQQDLASALREASEPFGLAPLAAYLPDHRLLVQDEVPAISLRDVIRKDYPEKAQEAVRRAARAIAALHRLPVTAPEHRTELGRTDPKRLRRFAEILGNSHPDLATTVADIEAQILADLDTVGAMPAVPIHGDLKPLHLLMDEERVVLLDLDKFAAGDPMLDVANMLVPLLRERNTGAALARVFETEYFAHAPAPWRQRLAPLYAWALLADAATFAVGLRQSQAEVRARRPGNWDHLVNFLVDEARAVLARRA